MAHTTATVTKQPVPHSGSICLNDIWRLARRKWEAAGRPDGDSSRFWLDAERELLQAPCSAGLTYRLQVEEPV
jgi:hypothetical protein